MKKSHLYLLLVCTFIFAIYNIVVWVLIPHGSPNFMVGYIFTIIAFVLCVFLTFLPIKNGSNRIDTIVKGMPVAVISVVFLCVQSIFGIIFMLLPEVLTKAVIVIEIILLLVFFSVVFGLGAARNYADEVDDTNDLKRDLRVELINTIQRLYRNTYDSAAKTALIQLVDDIRTCNGERLVQNSGKLFSMVEEIQIAVEEQKYDSVLENIKKIKSIL